jgi:alpha-beta hydrolase superfamily lysophospholipase
VGGYGALTLLTAEVTTKDHAENVPATLPMLFVAGGMDPVGACGKQVLEAVELYRGAGVLDVRLVLYPGLRHEILNEPSHDKVDADILSWIEDHLPA